MGDIIVIVLLVAQFWNTVKKRPFENSIVFYFMMAIVAPMFHIGATSISYEIIGFILLLIQYVVANGMVRIKLDKIDLLLLLIIIIEIMISAFSASLYEFSFPVIGCFALVRYYLLFEMLKRSDLKQSMQDLDIIMSVSLIVNVLTSFIQVSIPQSVTIFNSLYGRESNGVLALYEKMGYYNRAVGTFGTPTLVGPFALCCFAFFFYNYIAGKRIARSVIFILLSVALGVLALSKSFIIGCPLIAVVILLLFARCMGNVNRILRILLIVAIFFGALSIMLPIFIEKTSLTSGTVSYYFNMLQDPVKALSTRYSSEGNLNKAMDVFYANPLVGVGVSSIRNEFLGDSAYVNLLHNTGVIGAIIILAVVIALLRKTYKEQNLLGTILIVTILLVGIGIPIITNIMCVLLVGFGLKNSISEYDIRQDNSQHKRIIIRFQRIRI